MINAYQAKRTASRKSWTALTNHVERKVMEAISFGDYCCRVNTSNTNIEELARTIVELCQSGYSVDVKPFVNNSWQLNISWDDPFGRVIGKWTGDPRSLVNIKQDVEANADRVKALKSALLSVACGEDNNEV